MTALLIDITQEGYCYARPYIAVVDKIKEWKDVFNKHEMLHKTIVPYDRCRTIYI